MRTTSFSRWATLAVLFATPVAFADNDPGQSKTAVKEKLADSDVQLLAHVHRVNQMEIQLSQLAEKQSQSKAVKDYAKQIVDDHRANDREIVAFAKKHGVQIPKETAMNETERKDMKAEKDELDRMRGMKGADFDRTYLQDMANDHDKEVANIDSEASKAQNADLQQMFKDMKPVLQRHADMARTALKNVGAATSSASPRS